MWLCCVSANRTETDKNLDRVLSGLGWGLVVILAGALWLADNLGWTGGHWGRYFLIGLGGIFILGFLVRFFGGHTNLWGAYIRLVIGLALVSIGAAIIYDVGEWWPLALIPVGLAIIFLAFQKTRRGWCC